MLSLIPVMYWVVGSPGREKFYWVLGVATSGQHELLSLSHDPALKAGKLLWCDEMILQQLQSALSILSGLELCQLSLINNSSSHVMHTLYHGRGSRVLYNTVKCTQKTSLFLCTVNPRQSDPVQKNVLLLKVPLTILDCVWSHFCWLCKKGKKVRTLI